MKLPVEDLVPGGLSEISQSSPSRIFRLIAVTLVAESSPLGIMLEWIMSLQREPAKQGLRPWQRRDSKCRPSVPSIGEPAP